MLKIAYITKTNYKNIDAWIVQPDNSSCDVSELEPGRLLRCTDRNNLPVTVAYDVPTGSSCDIICPYKEVKAWVTCDDGRWNDFYLQCKRTWSVSEIYILNCLIGLIVKSNCCWKKVLVFGLLADGGRVVAMSIFPKTKMYSLLKRLIR